MELFAQLRNKLLNSVGEPLRLRFLSTFCVGSLVGILEFNRDTSKPFFNIYFVGQIRSLSDGVELL